MKREISKQKNYQENIFGDPVLFPSVVRITEELQLLKPGTANKIANFMYKYIAVVNDMKIIYESSFKSLYLYGNDKSDIPKKFAYHFLLVRKDYLRQIDELESRLGLNAYLTSVLKVYVVSRHRQYLRDIGIIKTK